MPLYDSHLHLQDPRLKSVLVEILDLYANLGVKRVVVNGTEEGDWEGVGQLAEMFSFVKPAFGPCIAVSKRVQLRVLGPEAVERF